MAWTAPTTRNTGDLITAAIWNTDLKDNLDYLKTEADKLDDVSVNDVTGTKALDTNYENTFSKILLVVVSIQLQVNSSGGAGNSNARALVENATPPTVQVDECKLQAKGALNDDIESYGNVVMMVPPSYYYRVTSVNAGTGLAPSISDWIEYQIH